MRRSERAATQAVEIDATSEVGVIRPELHGQFAERLGSCIYGGLRARPSPMPTAIAKAAIDYRRELGIPVLRWPGRSRSAEVGQYHWGDYVEDNSFGAHDFIGLCRLIGAEL